MSDINWTKVQEGTEIDEHSHYLVQDNGSEWRDWDLHLLSGFIVKRRLTPEYVRGRPVWIAKINRPPVQTNNTFELPLLSEASHG